MFPTHFHLTQGCLGTWRCDCLVDASPLHLRSVHANSISLSLMPKESHGCAVCFRCSGMSGAHGVQDLQRGFGPLQAGTVRIALQGLPSGKTSSKQDLIFPALTLPHGSVNHSMQVGVSQN